MAARPLVSVFSGSDASVSGTATLPGVFSAPIRLDVVHHVHRDIAKNRRQSYAVADDAGHQTSAESWGTGRAVSRIPRVPGGGTHRAGQGAFGNMCRGGRMFNPTKTFRRWHRRVNKNQRRFAICSALAASASVPLVMARGHRVERLPELPLVVKDDTISNLDKTSSALALLTKLGADDDVAHAKNSRKIRSGKGKSRNRRYVQRKGPLVIYDQKGPMVHAFRNLPGVDLCSVNSLNILSLAPGGHLGRFCIWTQSAFEKLDTLYGSSLNPSSEKKGFNFPRACVTNSDIGRVINSDEIQSVVRPAGPKHKRRATRKRNPLKNFGAMVKLNPHAKNVRRRAILQSQREKRSTVTNEKRNKKNKIRKARNAAFVKSLLA